MRQQQAPGITPLPPATHHTLTRPPPLGRVGLAARLSPGDCARCTHCSLLRRLDNTAPANARDTSPTITAGATVRQSFKRGAQCPKNMSPSADSHHSHASSVSSCAQEPRGHGSLQPLQRDHVDDLANPCFCGSFLEIPIIDLPSNGAFDIALAITDMIDVPPYLCEDVRRARAPYKRLPGKPAK